VKHAVFLFPLIGLTAVVGSSRIALAADPGDVAINEIAWMGTTSSTADEWVELRNNTQTTINLSGWSLEATDGTPVIALSGTIPPYGYVLLERTDDTSVPEVTAHQIYTGAMENGSEVLELRDDTNTLIDEVDDWHAGFNASGVSVSMERVDPLSSGTDSANWADALDTYSGGSGTPGAVNSNYSDGTGVDDGCDYPESLEITAINIGQGDATLIATPTRLLLADAGESYWNSHNDAAKVADVIADKYGVSCDTLDYVIISHLHLDHIGYITAEENEDGDLLNSTGGVFVEGQSLMDPAFLAGFAYLVEEEGFVVGQTLFRDYVTHNPNPDPSEGGSKTYRNWRAYLASPEGEASFNPTTAALGSHQVDLGTVDGVPVELDIVLVDGATPANQNGCNPATYFDGYPLRGDRTGDSVPPSENDLSVAFIVSLGAFQAFVGGDTSGENYASGWGYRYHDTETCLAEDSIVQDAYGGHLEVLRVNHHGSSHSTNQTFVDTFSPLVAIFSVGDNNSFDHVDTEVLDRVLDVVVGDNSGSVYLTESGAGVTQASDACHTSEILWCAEVADGEYPSSTESNEAGDPGVTIVVHPSGGSFSVQGNPGIAAVTYPSIE